MDNFILTNVLPPIIILVGISGNTFGQILVGRKKVSKIGPVLIYKFIFDNINLSIYYYFIYFNFKNNKFILLLN